MDYIKIGQQIALLRKEKALTGEKLAEILGVSPQAVSKWENGKCLPETALLPKLSKTLSCSIDTLLIPQELTILEAIYTDGNSYTNVTHIVNSHIRDNKLELCVSVPVIGASIEGNRVKLLTVKYQTPNGIYYTYGLQNEVITIDLNEGQTNKLPYLLLGAYYGNENGYSPAMKKMEHYEFFKWNEIHVNHETFPSNTAADDTEYLTLIYLNKTGIHVISCAENEVLYYEKNRTEIHQKDSANYLLPEIDRLGWGNGKECPWAGSLYIALKFLGEDYTYEQIMGMSGASYRVCFVDVWDWSCTDALVAFDFATPLYLAIGYHPIWANRLEKIERKAERLSIMRDLEAGKPVLAINLRVAPEWGVITGYIENGHSFLCRTYFDTDVFAEWETDEYEENEDKRITFEERGGYLVNDYWPFLITHFGEKTEKPTNIDILKTSLKTLVEVFQADQCRGYYQGKQAYEQWMKGLARESDFDIVNDKDNVLRRIGVNESMLFQLLDARRSAGEYLRECIDYVEGDKNTTLTCIVENFNMICKDIREFRDIVSLECKKIGSQNKDTVIGVITPDLRKKQIQMLEGILKREEENVMLANEILLQFDVK